MELVLIAVMIVGPPVLVWAIKNAAVRENEREQERAAALRQRYNRIMQASERPPQAPGWPHKRVG